jgi:hypothetical protein
MGAGGIPIGDATQEAGQGRFTRDLTNDVNYRVRGAISWDVRQQTEYGTLRTYIRFGAENTTPAATGGGTTFNPFWDRAFIQFAGFTVGRSQSFFDLFTYGGAYSYHNVRVSGDTGASGQNLWAYTAQFGNGFSGTLSLEDPATRKGVGTIDVTAPAFFGFNGATVNDNGMTINTGAGGGFGFRVPDIIANLRVDQTWGFAGISASLHDASGAYYLTPNSVNNGHPEDKYGWALAAGAKFNLPGSDMIGFNVCYSEGAAGFCTNQNSFQAYGNSTNRLDRRRRVRQRHPDRAHAGVECSCRVRAYLEPEMADRVGWRLCQRRLQQRRDQPDQRAAPRSRSGELRRGGGRGDHRCLHPRRRQQLQSGLQLLGSLYPHPVEPGAAARYRSAGDVYPPQHRVQRRGGLGGERVAARSRQRHHRRPECLVRDVPLAAQLLSMIA